MSSTKSPSSKARDAAYQSAKYHKRKALMRTIKGVTCADCWGVFHHSQLQFDHREATSKMFAIAQRMGVKNMDIVLAEIRKCDVVCANCHARRTWNRQHPDDTF